MNATAIPFPVAARQVVQYAREAGQTAEQLALYLNDIDLTTARELLNGSLVIKAVQPDGSFIVYQPEVIFAQPYDRRAVERHGAQRRQSDMEGEPQ